MNQSMPSEELQLLIAGYVLNDLSDEEAAIIEELLKDAEVMQAVEQMQLAVEQAYAPDEVQPSPQLRSVIMNFAESTQPIVNQRVEPDSDMGSKMPSKTSSVVLLPRWVKLLGALAAVLITGLSLSNYLLWRSLRIQQARVNTESLVLSLQPTTNVNLSPEVVVTADPETLRGTLAVKNLPPLEPGKVYVLWTVLAPDAPFTTDPKNAILTQVFSIPATGEQTQPLILPRAFQDPTLVEAFAITVEDATSPQRHQSSPILIQKL
ncbi:MAG: anti-sigma factor [Microcoleaceae cyanobacterium]